MRVGSVSTGALHLKSSNNLRLVGPRFSPRTPSWLHPRISEAPVYCRIHALVLDGALRPSRNERCSCPKCWAFSNAI